jgi:hypothetical protein
MCCSISEGILPVHSWSSSNSDYFGLVIPNTLDESTWFHTLSILIPGNFVFLNSFICFIWKWTLPDIYNNHMVLKEYFQKCMLIFTLPFLLFLCLLFQHLLCYES